MTIFKTIQENVHCKMKALVKLSFEYRARCFIGRKVDGEEHYRPKGPLKKDMVSSL